MFEFDKQKSIANKGKHDIDFIEAQKLWEDIDRLVIPVRNLDEPRFLMLGKLEGKIWAVIFTMRSEAIRIISVRRAQKEEIELYEN